MITTIIKELTTAEVVFHGPGLFVTDHGLQGAAFKAPWCTSTNFEALEVTTVPDDWQGRHYTFTQADGWVRTALGEAALADRIAKAQQDLKSECIKAVNQLIQSKVDAYTKPRGLILKDIDSCHRYKDEDPEEYPHQPFCAAVWAWSRNVWVIAEQRMEQALAGEIIINSPEDALTLLPEFTFNMS